MAGFDEREGQHVEEHSVVVDRDSSFKAKSSQNRAGRLCPPLTCGQKVLFCLMVSQRASLSGDPVEDGPTWRLDQGGEHCATGKGRVRQAGRNGNNTGCEQSKRWQCDTTKTYFEKPCETRPKNPPSRVT